MGSYWMHITQPFFCVCTIWLGGSYRLKFGELVKILKMLCKEINMYKSADLHEFFTIPVYSVHLFNVKRIQVN